MYQKDHCKSLLSLWNKTTKNFLAQDNYYFGHNSAHQQFGMMLVHTSAANPGVGRAPLHMWFVIVKQDILGCPIWWLHSTGEEGVCHNVEALLSLYLYHICYHPFGQSKASSQPQTYFGRGQPHVMDTGWCGHIGVHSATVYQNLPHSIFVSISSVSNELAVYV